MAKLYSLGPGTKVPEGILEIARREHISTAAVEGIGGVKELNLAYFNQETKKYEEHRFVEYMEAASLLGNLTLKDGEPFLHLHGNFGRRDLSVIGGHVVSAVVSPLLELTVTPTENTAHRRFDMAAGLSTIYKL